MEQNAPRGLTNRIAVSIQLSPPDRRRRDIDNSLKALLDSLTYAHVWEDDSQIDDIRIYRASCVQNGQAVVDISEIQNPLTEQKGGEANAPSS
jgi:crossover junction endodeoxyribonuclease RusA